VVEEQDGAQPVALLAAPPAQVQAEVLEARVPAQLQQVEDEVQSVQAAPALAVVDAAVAHRHHHQLRHQLVHAAAGEVVADVVVDAVVDVAAVPGERPPRIRSE
jgi:hypothetical protein